MNEEQDNRIEEAVAIANETGAFSEESVRRAGSILNQESPALTSDDLSEVEDFQLVQPETETAGVGLEGQIESQLAGEEKRRAREAETLGRQREQSLEDINRFFEETTGETELTARAGREAGLPKIQEELDDIDQQLRAEQHALRRQKERILAGAGTMTAGERNLAIADVERRSFTKQADLFIVRLGIQGRFDSAKSIADQKVNIQMERDERKFAALTLSFENSKELFTLAGQREFNASQNRLQNEINTKRETIQNINSLALDVMQNGAPSAIARQMLRSGSVEDAFRIGGQYINALARREANLGIQELEKKVSGSKDSGDAYGGLTPAELPELNQSERNDLISDWTVARSIKRMDELVSEVGLAGLLTGQGSPEAREFAQIKENVVDLLARERTGAVVGKDEAKSFRKILGVGAFSVLTSEDEAELKQIITRTLPLFEASLDTINPTGEWETYLDAKYPTGSRLEDPLGLGISGTPSNDPLGIIGFTNKERVSTGFEPGTFDIDLQKLNLTQ